MSVNSFLIIFISIQVVFVILDFIDRRLTRQSRYEGQPSKVETLFFLLTVFLAYAILQFGGLALVPQADELLINVCAYFGNLLGRPPSQQIISGKWLLLVSIFAFYIGGLWDYIIHRFFSHSRWFWFTHENHHLPNQVFVAMPGMVARPFVVASTFPVTAATAVSAYIMLAILDLPLWNLEPLKILLLINTFIGTSSHSSFCRRWWGVHHLMKYLALTTPQEHLLHHTVDLNGNFGNFTTLWDRLFGTYLDPTLEKHQGHALGLGYDQDFLGTLTLGKLKLSKQLRRRFQVERYCNID
jgi:sterol desaturase/sphingolipid hydroxylase (fatty acid hydroxylase superfamily)